MASPQDPTQLIRETASSYPNVDEGTACTQSSFKAGGKAFLFIGEQGGRYKAMFKLQDSIDQAQQLASKAPDDYQVGSWTTVRFTAEKPIPFISPLFGIWKKWLNESYALATTTVKNKTAKKTSTKEKQATRKTPQKKQPSKKKTKKKKTKKKKVAAKKSKSR